MSNWMPQSRISNGPKPVYAPQSKVTHPPAHYFPSLAARGVLHGPQHINQRATQVAQQAISQPHEGPDFQQKLIAQQKAAQARKIEKQKNEAVKTLTSNVARLNISLAAQNQTIEVLKQQQTSLLAQINSLNEQIQSLRNSSEVERIAALNSQVEMLTIQQNALNITLQALLDALRPPE